MADLTEQFASDTERVVRLGSALTEPGAHMIASVIEDAGIRVRVAGAETLGSMVLAGRQYSIEVLVFESDFEKARAIIEAIPTSDRALDAEGRCVLCRYDMEGVTAPVCPECGADLAALGGIERFFRLAPAPGEGQFIQNIGVVLGIGVVLMLALGLVAAIVLGVLQPA